MSNLSTSKEVVVKTDTMLGKAGAVDQEMFERSCEQFGSIRLAHTLLLHWESKMNNVDTTRQLKRIMDQDFNSAIRSAGEIMNTLGGRANSWVNSYQINNIKSGIAQMYQTMQMSGIKLTKHGFTYPAVAVEDDSE